MFNTAGNFFSYFSYRTRRDGAIAWERALYSRLFSLS